MSPAHFVIGGAVLVTVLVGIAVAPKAIEKLEDWAAERKERRKQKQQARAAEKEGAHLVAIRSSAEVMRARASGREAGGGGGEGEEGRLRHRHRAYSPPPWERSPSPPPPHARQLRTTSPSPTRASTLSHPHRPPSPAFSEDTPLLLSPARSPTLVGTSPAPAWDEFELKPKPASGSGHPSPSVVWDAELAAGQDGKSSAAGSTAGWSEVEAEAEGEGTEEWSSGSEGWEMGSERAGRVGKAEGRG